MAGKTLAQMREYRARLRAARTPEQVEADRVYQHAREERKTAADKRARNEYIQKWATNPENRLRVLVGQAKDRAIKKDIFLDENLLAFLLSKGAPTHCACCNVELDYSRGRGVGNRTRSASLDRVDNFRGYALDNVAIICFRCNSVKCQATLEDLHNLLSYVSRHLRVSVPDTTPPPEDGRDLFVFDPVPVVPTETFVEGG